MRKLVIVGSSIQARKGTFTYSPTRTVFSAEERFRQTIFTIASIKNCLPNAHIVVVDSSDDYKEYATILPMYGATFVPLKELSGEAFEIVNSHKNKSVCESVLLNTYYRQYRKQILEYDIVIKATGRYFYLDFNEESFTHDDIYFKKPLGFKWNDNWNYSFVDRRKEQSNDILHQYCTVLYAFGSKHLDKFIDINEAAIHLMNCPSMSHYDIETLSYYFTRPYQNILTETNWRVSGWDGTSGKLMYY